MSERCRSDVGPTSERRRKRRRSNVGAMSELRRSDVGATSARRRSDVGATSARCRSDVGPTVGRRRHCTSRPVIPTNHPGKTGKIPQNQHSSRIPTASLNFPLFFIKHSSTSFTQRQTFSLFFYGRLHCSSPRQGVYCKRSPARNTYTCMRISKSA